MTTLDPRSTAGRYALSGACLDEKAVVAFDYYPPAGEDGVRGVRPLNLRRTVLGEYVLTAEKLDHEIRSYRLDRMGVVTFA